jgi:hypothetical protein
MKNFPYRLVAFESPAARVDGAVTVSYTILFWRSWV